MKTIGFKTFSLLLCMFILFSLFPIAAFADGYDIRLNVPLRAQQAGNTCGDASARMCIEYYYNHGFKTGKSADVPTENDIVAEYGTADPGIITNGIRDYCGISYTKREKSSVSQEQFQNIIYNSISQGKPVVLDVYLAQNAIMGYTTIGGHFIVISGIIKWRNSAGQDIIDLVINDPWSPSGAGVGQIIIVNSIHMYNLCTQFYEPDDTIVSSSLHTINLDGFLDGQLSDDLGLYGSADIYINGSPVATYVTDYNTAWPEGTTYEIRCRTNEGYVYNGVYPGGDSANGTISDSGVNVILSYSTDENYIGGNNTYIASKAVEYALNWWNSFSPSWYNFETEGYGDCANFVSQCLYAGGLSMTDSWYWNSRTNYSGSWTIPQDQANYLRSKGYNIITFPSSDQISVGDVLLYDWEPADGRWDHSAICVAASGDSRTVCAHSEPCCSTGWTMGAPRYAVIQITERDNIPPTISNVSVYNISSMNYTVSCVVTDNEIVKEVKMPSWAVGTSSHGIEWPIAAGNDNSYRYTVTRSPGQYWETDIYAFDVNEKASMVKVLVKDCALTFDANGGTVSEENRIVYSVLIDYVEQNNYGELPTPTRDGYSFGGWYNELEGGERITAYSKVIDADTQKLYARWSRTCEHSYTVLDIVRDKTKEPTLSEPGYFTYTCSECGEEIVESYPILNGTDYEVERIESTCTEVGYDRYTYLGNDAFQLSFDVDLPLAEHHYEIVNVPSVDGNLGYAMYICSICGDSHKDYNSNDWTAWSEIYPSEVNASLIESKTQYRAKTRETTTSSISTLDGWTLSDTTSDWGAYGDWSEWGDIVITSDDSTEVETRTVYPYYYFYCTKCGLHARYPYSGIQCEICKRNDTILASTGTVEWYTNLWSDSVAWGSNTGKYYQYIDGSILWNYDGDTPKSQYRSRIREMETTYHFYRWTEWSDWSDQVETATDDREVETRTVYRYAVISTEYPDKLIIIPSGTNVIEEESFYGINAEYVFIPASVSEVKSLAFAACPNLKVVYFENGNNIAVAENFVSGCDRMLVIDAPDGSAVANNISTFKQYLSNSVT